MQVAEIKTGVAVPRKIDATCYGRVDLGDLMGDPCLPRVSDGPLANRAQSFTAGNISCTASGSYRVGNGAVAREHEESELGGPCLTCLKMGASRWLSCVAMTLSPEHAFLPGSLGP